MLSSLSGFLVSNGSRNFWMTAGHIYLEMTASALLLLVPDPDQLAKKRGTNSTARAKIVLLDSERPFDTNTMAGVDFGYFPADAVKLDTSLPAPHAVQIRNLKSQPLEMDETLFISGYQNSGFSVIPCRFRGYSADFLRVNNSAMIMMECFDVESDGRSLLLGGLSGALIADGGGNAVGVFNGYSTEREKPLIFVTGTAIVASDQNLARRLGCEYLTSRFCAAFRGYPSHQDIGQQCLSCFDHRRAESNADFDEHSDKYLTKCEFSSR